MLPAVGLRDELTTVGQIDAPNLDRAGSHENDHIGPPLVHHAGKLHPVETPRHVDVGEHRIDVRPLLERHQGVLAVMGIHHVESGVLQRLHGIHEDQRLVFDDEHDGLGFVGHLS